jgi:LuxR family maltose regulon positive regulatory protein
MADMDAPTPALTAGEVRLLPLLATQLSLVEIARLLEVPRSEIEAQAILIYRKLGIGPELDPAA